MYVQIRLVAHDQSVDDKYHGGDCLNEPFFVLSMSSFSYPAVSYQSVGDVIFIFLIYL